MPFAVTYLVKPFNQKKDFGFPPKSHQLLYVIIYVSFLITLFYNELYDSYYTPKGLVSDVLE